MLIGYARVSKQDGSQSLDLQHDALQGAGVPLDRIYDDQASGKHEARPGLLACLKALRALDILVVWKLDRLGRDLKHLVTLVDDLTTRGVGLKVLTGQGASLDTTTANGRLVFGIFAALAEYERALIIERTNAGLAAARARGRIGGRPRQMRAKTVCLMQATLRSRSLSVSALAKELGIHRATVYDYVRPDGQLTAMGQALAGDDSKDAAAAD